jgi:hypothetical protein
LLPEIPYQMHSIKNISPFILQPKSYILGQSLTLQKPFLFSAVFKIEAIVKYNIAREHENKMIFNIPFPTKGGTLF